MTRYIKLSSTEILTLNCAKVFGAMEQHTGKTTPGRAPIYWQGTFINMAGSQVHKVNIYLLRKADKDRTDKVLAKSPPCPVNTAMVSGEAAAVERADILEHLGLPG